MAQSALTVTPPNPSPPTNMSSTGATGPNPPNYTKNTYNDPKNWSAINPKDFPPPFFDDGAAGSLVAIAANTAALASGSAATAGGTEGTYPGADTAPIDQVNQGGPVPASTSVANEAAGTEVVVTATVPNPSPDGQLRTISVLGSYTNNPNAQHASSLSPTTNPTFTSFTAGSSVSGVGTTTLSCVTVGATKQSVVYVNGVAQTTVFVSPTSLTCAAVTKKTTPGNWDIKIVTGGVVETAPRTWTFT